VNNTSIGIASPKSIASNVGESSEYPRRDSLFKSNRRSLKWMLKAKEEMGLVLVKCLFVQNEDCCKF